MCHMAFTVCPDTTTVMAAISVHRVHIAIYHTPYHPVAAIHARRAMYKLSMGKTRRSSVGARLVRPVLEGWVLMPRRHVVHALRRMPVVLLLLLLLLLLLVAVAAA